MATSRIKSQKKIQAEFKEILNMKEDVIKCFLAERAVQSRLENLCVLGWVGGWKGLEGKSRI